MKVEAQDEFRNLTTDECIKYIQSFKVDLKSYDSTLSIPSRHGLIYRLPNNEIVLIPNNLRKDYVGFIYKDVSQLNKMVSNGWFPLADKYLTVWEIEKRQLEALPKSVSYFKEVLKGSLQLSEITYEDSSFEQYFDSLKKVINSKSIGENLKHKMVVAYAIIYMDYLVINENAKWHLTERSETYNTYIYPMVKTYRIKDVIATLYITLENKALGFSFFKGSLRD